MPQMHQAALEYNTIIYMDVFIIVFKQTKPTYMLKNFLRHCVETTKPR